MFPNAVGVGDMRDYHLFHPQISRDRWIDKRDGESVDLGDSKFVFLDAVWKDLTATMWAYDTRTKSLFSADGVGFMHEHEPHVCGLFASELPPEIQPGDKTRFALPYVAMGYQDMRPSVQAFRDLLEKYPVEIVCSSHGAPVQRGPHFTGFVEQLLKDTVDPNKVLARRVVPRATATPTR
jgi:flavorubredoxin